MDSNEDNTSKPLQFGCPKCRSSWINCRYCGKAWSAVQAALDERARKRVQCKLCSRDGYSETVLCKAHLEGYAYAAALLNPSGRTVVADSIMLTIRQQKGSDNGR